MLISPVTVFSPVSNRYNELKTKFKPRKIETAGDPVITHGRFKLMGNQMLQEYNMVSWDGFYTQFKHSEIGKQLAGALPQKILRQFLSPVLTLASAIKEWDIKPERPEHWIIRIHGAELPEAGDDGRWFDCSRFSLGKMPE